MNILILDDHPLVRSGIRSALSTLETKYIIIEANSILTALKLFTSTYIDIVLVDLNLGKGNKFMY